MTVTYTMIGQTSVKCALDLQQQGFAVLHNFLNPTQLEELRLEADTLWEVACDVQQSTPATTSGRCRSWGREATTSCIFESLPGRCGSPELCTSYSTYRQARSTWPLRPSVWRILFQSQLTRLVTRLLGPGAVLFNDQASSAPLLLLLHADRIPSLISSRHCVQYILKTPCTTSAFPWHRDSEWCRSSAVSYQPYLSGGFLFLQAGRLCKPTSSACVRNGAGEPALSRCPVTCLVQCGVPWTT